MSEIFIIGDTTIGKNVGSISLYEANDPKNTWGMQPIVVKSYNSLNESDYSEGFIPNIANNDNSLYIFPLGDPQEELLSLAIGEIVGSGGRKDASVSKAGLETIGSSVDRKRGRFNLLIDDERLVKFLKSGVLTTP
jgi:carboxyl-terminal processing protease